MQFYSITLLLVSVLLVVLGVRISAGHTELIHSYHQKNVKDRAGYGKAMGRALLVLASCFAAAGLIGFSGNAAWALTASNTLLILGIVFAIVMIFIAQKKYNGGLF